MHAASWKRESVRKGRFQPRCGPSCGRMPESIHTLRGARGNAGRRRPSVSGQIRYNAVRIAASIERHEACCCVSRPTVRPRSGERLRGIREPRSSPDSPHNCTFGKCDRAFDLRWGGASPSPSPSLSFTVTRRRRPASSRRAGALSPPREAGALVHRRSTRRTRNARPIRAS